MLYFIYFSLQKILKKFLIHLRDCAPASIIFSSELLTPQPKDNFQISTYKGIIRFSTEAFLFFITITDISSIIIPSRFIV